MVKIKLTHLSLGQKEMKLRAEYHVHKMDKNLTYAAHQADVTDLETLNDSYGDAIHDAQDGGKPLTRAKVKLKDTVSAQITAVAKDVQDAANKLPEAEQEEYVLGAGFELSLPAVKTVIDSIDTPTILSIVRTEKGALLLKYSKSANAVTYMIEETDKDGNGLNHKFSDTNSLLITGLVPNSTHFYHIKAVGPGTLSSGFSELMGGVA